MYQYQRNFNIPAANKIDRYQDSISSPDAIVPNPTKVILALIALGLLFLAPLIYNYHTVLYAH